VPATSGLVRRDVNVNRIRPSTPGAGFPMSIEWDADEDPTGKN
jgi:hypothetical protein